MVVRILEMTWGIILHHTYHQRRKLHNYDDTFRTMHYLCVIQIKLYIEGRLSKCKQCNFYLTSPAPVLDQTINTTIT